jgi:hypothetical protein
MDRLNGQASNVTAGVRGDEIQRDLNIVRILGFRPQHHFVDYLVEVRLFDESFGGR